MKAQQSNTMPVEKLKFEPDLDKDLPC